MQGEQSEAGQKRTVSVVTRDVSALLEVIGKHRLYYLSVACLELVSGDFVVHVSLNCSICEDAHECCSRISLS